MIEHRRAAAGARTGGGRLAALLLVLALLLPGVVAGTGHTGVRAQGTPSAADEGVTTLTGSVTVTNPFILNTYPEHFMALIDLSGFVARDLERPLPSTVQITTGLTGDWSSGATFSLPLPIVPPGTLNDVAHGEGGDGVQIYSLDLQANLVGDPFLGRNEYEGWTTSLTSLAATFDTGEVTGGRVVVWSPGEGERFPSDFGADGKLFTADDPTASIPAGWTVVDLDQRPFAQIRDASVEVPILEGDAGVKDLSALTFTEAFDALVADLRLRYPFTEEKGIDWDALVAQIRPGVAFAEQRYDVLAFNVALMYFTTMIGDGHVAVTLPAQWIYATYGGGIGVYLGLTDDRQITLRCVRPDTPAAAAGMLPAAEIVRWNGQDPLAVLAQSEEIFSSSTEINRDLRRLTWMARMKPGDSVEIEFRNPGETETQTATIEAVVDPVGLGSEPCGYPTEDPAAMPVTVDVLPSGIGLISVNTFSDDAILMTHAWEWAIERLNALDVPAVVVDVRTNGGGSGWLATYFAGSFTSSRFQLNTAFVSNEQGARIEAGETWVEPSPQQWTKPVAVLVSAGCASACELFAAAVAHDPSHLIVGRTPSAGVEAGVIPWVLPGGLAFQAPVIAFHNPDGSIFLEGEGVIPNVHVPNTAESLVMTEDDDYPLSVAEEALSEALVQDVATPVASPVA